MKLAENNIENNVKEIIADYEINIHKAIDEMMPDTEILGCFFHLAKAVQEKVDKYRMKKIIQHCPGK